MVLYELADVGNLLVIGIISGFGFGTVASLMGHVIGFLFGLLKRAF